MKLFDILILGLSAVTFGVAWIAYELKNAEVMPDCYDSEDCVRDCSHCPLYQGGVA